MAEIPLTGGGVAIVDEADLAALGRHRWKRTRNGYAARNAWISEEGRYRRLYMHRVVARTPAGMDTDHVNGNRLDNRRDNLRVCSRSQNLAAGRGARSRSKYSRFRGARFIKARQKWDAYITIENRSTYIGRFDTEIEAARAYDGAARALHGEFARLNFPDD